jgi:L-asparagine oxygenase
VAGAMGLRIMAYETMTNTAFIRNISPTLEHSEKMGSYGSKVKLPMHTEISQGKLPGGEPGVNVSPSPDFLVLYCCRNDERAPTTFCLLETILAGMPEWAVEALKQPKFEVSGGDSFTTANVLNNVALLRPDPVTGWLQLRYNGTNIKSDDPACAEAFKILEDRLDDPEVVQRVTLEPGDLLVLENRRTTHGREPFNARHDGTDRWLLRLYTVRESSFDERVCTDPAKPNSWYV